MTAWLDYVDARRRLIHEWHAQGVDAVDIGFRLELESSQVSRIIEQHRDPPLQGTARYRVQALERRVAALERELHRRDSEPPAPTGHVPRTSQIRALLSNPDPALCGCRFFKDDGEVLASEAHHPDCVFPPKPPE